MVQQGEPGRSVYFPHPPSLTIFNFCSQYTCSSDSCTACDVCTPKELTAEELTALVNEPMPPPPPPAPKVPVANNCQSWCNSYTCDKPECSECDGQEKGCVGLSPSPQMPSPPASPRQTEEEIAASVRANSEGLSPALVAAACKDVPAAMAAQCAEDLAIAVAEGLVGPADLLADAAKHGGTAESGLVDAAAKIGMKLVPNGPPSPPPTPPEPHLPPFAPPITACAPRQRSR